MKDRVPRYPGRIMLRPVTNVPDTYTMYRQDAPTEEGTPINKATLLQDDTAALYGLGPDATPDDVFRALAAPDYATKLIIHIDTEDGGNVGNTRVRISNSELGVNLTKPLDALDNVEFDVLQGHTYYVLLIDYPDKYYGAAALIQATGGQVQRETLTLPTEPDVIGWRIDESTSTVEYTDGASDWIPASMSGGNFDPGSVGGCWLFKNIRPCVLKNGVVQYYLDPNDFTKRADGDTADITSGDDGDVMIEFPLVYYKFYEEQSEGKTWKGCKFSLTQPDNTYCANAYLSEGDVIQQTMYMSAYEGALIDGKLRSLSGATAKRDTSITNFRTYATANGKGYQQQEWTKRVLLQAMFVMLFKTTDSQSAIGIGNSHGLTNTTGILDKKGMFWGSQNNTNGIKFCGIENFWGNSSKMCEGFFISSRTYRYKIRAPYDDDNRFDESLDPFWSNNSFSNEFIGGMTYGNAYGMSPNSTTDSESGPYYDTFAHEKTSGTEVEHAVTGYNTRSDNGFGIFCFIFSVSQSPKAYLSYTPRGG